MRLLLVIAAVLLAGQPAMAQETGPQHVHLGIPDSDPAAAMSVVWYQTAAAADPRVRLTGPDGVRDVAAEAVPGPSAGFVYEARLDMLQAATDYTYDIADRSFPFRTPADDLSAPLRLVALGDMGSNDRSRATAALVDTLAPDLVLHAGDISYAEGIQLDWHDWFDMVEPVAARHPWMTALGNHEVGPAGIGNTPASTELLYYKQRFSLPHNELWYAFDWAGVHFVALDTYSDALAPSAEEVAWLEDDLAANADAAWTIVFLHEPPYSSNDHGSSARVQEAFVPLFDEYGVDLVIAGHDHGYERSHPMRGGEVVARDPTTSNAGEGTVYIVTGGGGQSLYSDWAEPAPPWSAARAALYHVVQILVNETEIVGTVVPTLEADFHDTFRIVKGPDPTPASTPAGRDTPSASLPFLIAACLAASAWTARAARNLHHAPPGPRAPRR